MKVDQRFHCFGCGADGDVIDFTAKLFNLSLIHISVVYGWFTTNISMTQSRRICRFWRTFITCCGKMCIRDRRGIQTNIGSLNREIKAANNLMKSIRQLIQNLKGWITELGEKRKELLVQKAAEEATLLPNLLMKYMEIRKEERKDWTRAGQNRGTSQDLKAVSEALSYLRQKGLSTVEDLEAFLESSGKSAADYRNQMKPKEICLWKYGYPAVCYSGRSTLEKSHY